MPAFVNRKCFRILLPAAPLPKFQPEKLKYKNDAAIPSQKFVRETDGSGILEEF